MRSITLLPAAERQAKPWKNGGGTTREIAVFPEGADLDHFDWRISTASVAAPGAFSHFSGVDRVLAVIEGRLHLHFKQRGVVEELTPSSTPCAFPADVEIFGTPDGCDVIDLNVMVRRGKWTALIERILPGSSQVALPEFALVLMTGGGRIKWRSGILSLHPYDAVMIDGAGGETISIESPCPTHVIGLAPTKT